MTAFSSLLRHACKLAGFRFKTFWRHVRDLPIFMTSYVRMRRQAKRSREPFAWGPMYPILEDRLAQAGVAKGHYFHQDLYVARRILANRPIRHIDVGSRVDGFVAHVATFRSIEVVDIRPLSSHVANLKFLSADVTQALPSELHEATDSLSCLHALEHFGLGRYGDAIDFEGHLVGLENFYRMLKPGGKLYLSTPIGRRQRIEFNAHRVFSMTYLLEKLHARYALDRFAYVDDDGDLHEEVDPHSASARRSFDLRYGCGIFELTKKAA